MRRCASLLLAAACAAALACGSDAGRPAQAPAASAPGAPERGGIARVGVLGDPSTFLDWEAGTTVDLYAADLVFRKLARPTSAPGKLAPDLAESWQILPDGRSIAFRLREGARWEDGREMTAEDVAFTGERARCCDASTLPWKRMIEKVEATSPREVVFHFLRRDPEMLQNAAYGHVYPRHLLESVDPKDIARHPFNQKPVGSGPFRLEKWEAQQYLSLVARPDRDSAGAPYLDGVVLRVFADKSAALRELEGGGLDLLLKVNRETADRLASRSDLTVRRTPTRGYLFIVWNTKRAPWDRVEIRQALAASIDRNVLASRFEGTEEAVATGPVPPDHPWRDPSASSRGHDPGFAAERFAAAGLRKSSEGRWLTDKGAPVKLTLRCPKGSQLHQEIAAIVAADLRKAGLEVEVSETDGKALRAMLESQEGDFDAAVTARPDLPTDLAGCFGTGGGENYAKLSDPELDSLFDAMQRETDPERARTSFARAERRVAELAPWAFLFYRSDTIVTSRRLHGLEDCPLDPMECAAQWWISKGPQQ